ARRRANGRSALLPVLRRRVEEPGVGEQLVKPVAAEQHHLAIDRVEDEPGVSPRYWLALRLQLFPVVICRRVKPGAGVATFGRNISAAEQDELFRRTVVAHRRPEQDAAQRLLRVRRWGEVLPFSPGRIVAEGAAAGIEVEGSRVGVVIKFLSEGEGAVDGPVRARDAGGVVEAPGFIFPTGSRGRPELRAPVLTRREVVSPAASGIKR